MAWRIYYENGKTHDSTDVGRPRPYGVQAILQTKRKDGRYYITSNFPYYILNEKGSWIGCWMNDVEDILCHDRPIECFVKGMVVDKDEFMEIYEQVKRDKNLEALG